MKNNQQGFGNIETIVLFAVIAIVGFSGWWVYSHDKVNNTEPNIEPTAINSEESEKPKEESAPAKTANVYAINELGISITLEPGWATAGKASEPDVNEVYAFTNPDSPITIVAFRSNAPAGFEGCTSADEMLAVVPRLISDTKISGVVVYEDDNSGLSLADGSTEYASTTKSLDAPKVRLSDLVVGNTYYQCTQASAPISWSVDFDNNIANKDGVYTHTGAQTGKISSMVGYDSVVKMLQSVSRL